MPLTQLFCKFGRNPEVVLGGKGYNPYAAVDHLNPWIKNGDTAPKPPAKCSADATGFCKWPSRRF